jgi:hypothetical protein
VQGDLQEQQLGLGLAELVGHPVEGKLLVVVGPVDAADAQERLSRDPKERLTVRRIAFDTALPLTHDESGPGVDPASRLDHGLEAPREEVCHEIVIGVDVAPGIEGDRHHHVPSGSWSKRSIA